MHIHHSIIIQRCYSDILHFHEIDSAAACVEEGQKYIVFSFAPRAKCPGTCLRAVFPKMLSVHPLGEGTRFLFVLGNRKRSSVFYFDVDADLRARFQIL